MLLELKLECPCRGESEKMFMKLHLRFAIVIVVWLEFFTVSLTFVLLKSVGCFGDVRTASSSKSVCTHLYFVYWYKLIQLGIWLRYRFLKRHWKLCILWVEKRREEKEKRRWKWLLLYMTMMSADFIGETFFL